MELNSLSNIVSVIIVLSVASERLVEIIKGLIPAINKANPDPAKEGRRKALLQSLAVIAGVVTSIIAMKTLQGVVPDAWNTPMGVFGLGLLASGGSGFWNSVLGYVNEVKNIKKAAAKSG